MALPVWRARVSSCLACEQRFCPSQALTARRCLAVGESRSPHAKAVPEGHSRGRWGTRACEFSYLLPLHKLLQQGPALFWRQTKLMVYERSFLESRFAVLIRRPARLIAQADGDLVAPFAHLQQGPIVVCRIVIGLFQLVDTFLEPLMGVVFIVGDAGTEHVDESKALVLYALGDEVGEVLLLSGRAARHIGGASDQRHSKRIEIIFWATTRGRFGPLAPFCGRRRLASGQAVDLVVHNHIGEINVTAHRVDKMLDTNTIAITVATGNNPVQVMVAELHASGLRQSTAVRAGEAVG